jgi:RNA polymerase sigma-70 factor (ECF subfamily)
MSTEQELTQRIMNRDENALGEYVNLKEKELLAFINRNMNAALKTKLESADILQEVMLAGLNGLASIDLSTRTPFAWLCHLAEQRIIDAHRALVASRKRAANKEQKMDSPQGDGQRGLIDVLVVSMTSPSQAFARGEKEWELQQAMLKLSPIEQQAIRLRYIDKLSTKDIAEQIGKTDGATRVLLTRALDQLHRCLEGHSAFQSFFTDPRQ